MLTCTQAECLVVMAVALSLNQWQKVGGGGGGRARAPSAPTVPTPMVNCCVSMPSRTSISEHRLNGKNVEIASTELHCKDCIAMTELQLLNCKG